MNAQTVVFWTAAGIAVVVALVVAWRQKQAETRQKEAETRRAASEQAERQQRAKDHADFMKSAKLVRARILSSAEMGMINLKPNFQIRLRVEAPDGPFEVEVEEHVDHTDVHRLADGRMVDVWFNPERRDRVVLELDREVTKLLRESRKMLSE